MMKVVNLLKKLKLIPKKDKELSSLEDLWNSIEELGCDPNLLEENKRLPTNYLEEVLRGEQK